MTDVNPYAELLDGGDDASVVAAMAEAIRAAMDPVTLSIGQLMIDGDEPAALRLRDYAQLLPSAADVLDRLYEALNP